MSLELKNVEKKAGIETEKLIIDPGVGFGKSGDDNITLLKNESLIFWK